jgi:hypothetical protein
MVITGLLDPQVWNLPSLTQDLGGIHKDAATAGTPLDVR